MPVITITVAYEIGDGGRPSGAGYVRYEDLYRAGDTVNDALARLVEPAVITFPAGRFEQADFAYGNHYCIYVPKNCKGLWGSGMGALGDDSGTIFTMTPKSSTKTSPAQSTGANNALNLLYHSSDFAPVYRNFHVEGTDQGGDSCCYHAFSIFNPGGPADVKNVLATGWEGNANSPPGETMGLSMHGSNHHVVDNFVADGRREVGGPSYGAVGATAANCVGGKWTNCQASEVRSAGLVCFQSFDVETFGYTVKRTFTDRWLGASGINHERTDGTIHHGPVLELANTGRGVHCSHSNDSWSAAYDGTTRSIDDGSLTVHDPTFSDIWGDGKFYIQSWTPYSTGDTMSTAPVLTGARGKWVHGKTRLNIGG